MFRIMVVVCLAILATCFQLRRGKAPRVEPGFLDQLRREGRHEEFSYFIGASDPEEVIPRTDDSEAEWVGKGLCTMDFSTENIEEARQAAKVLKEPPLRWLKVNNNSFARVPFTIDPAFNAIDQRDILSTFLSTWNKNVPWIKWTNYAGEKDYVYIFWGKGCGSGIGRRGGQQGMQLTVGCVNDPVMLHEGMHIIGLLHEHQRLDRDEYIHVLWKNIYPNYTFAFEQINPKYYEDVGEYDYFTTMHYHKTAFTYDQNYSFNVLKEGINIDDVGMASTLTKLDIGKMKYMYDV